MKVKKKLTKADITLDQEIKLFRDFASWSKKRKYEYIKKSPPNRALTLKYTWKAWARDNQLTPEGNWSTWVIKAGRGFGKTRAGAEWVIEKARQYPGCHIALVGRTVADVRNVMVRGMSGILAISPPWFMPEYVPSQRQLVWPNGSHASTYSADSPDQMRGPQHSFAWCDERCFVAGTLIRTSKGLCPIEEIRPGDLVHTRGGLKRVKHAGLTNQSTTVYDLTTSDGRVLTGTGNHPVWVQDKGFKPLCSLSYGDMLMTWDQNKVRNTKLSTVSSGADADGGSTKDIIATEEESCCIESSIRQYTGQSLREWTSTTKTKTRPTMISQILRCLHGLNIRSDIGLEDGRFGTTKKDNRQVGSNGLTENHILLRVNNAARQFPLRGHVRGSAMELAHRHIDVKTLSRFLQSLAPSVANRSWFINQGCSTAHTNAGMRVRKKKINTRSALFAKKTFGQETQGLFVAQENVGLSTRIGGKRRQKRAFIAKRYLSLILLQKVFSVQSHAAIFIDTEVKQSKKRNISVTQVKQRSEKMAVFNMEVEDCHEYFANDVLVHNCSWPYDDAYDQLMFGLRIDPAPGIQPQCVVTTTPRNTKSMKALLKDPATYVTNGSTYDNKENLSKRFIHEIDKKYSGTRLGRQELLGEIIDDIDGALWKRDWIEDNRIQRGGHPELKRIVVGVDPPGSSLATSEDPAECGIVVVGLGVDNQGYVLADYSLIGTPNEWASAVLTAYAFFEADYIIGEVNFGGEMVGTIIKSLAKEKKMGNVPFKAVRASRGKQVRAEPVSNLYQQNAIHHVGTHPDLEDQQANWVPGEKSPDRLDACVWAITELMLGKNAVGGMRVTVPSKEEQQYMAYQQAEEDNQIVFRR